MKVLVCGGRDFNDYTKVQQVLAFLQPTSIVTGMARGADKLAWQFAKQFNIPTEEYPADWNQHGKSAGFRRNEQMLREAKPDLVIAFPGGNGTAHMIRISKAAGIRVKEI